MKISLSRFGCIVTVFGMVQFFFLTFLASFFYPGVYDYFGYYLSYLGAEVARNGEPNSISSKLFFAALTIVALALNPFWLIIRSVFKESRVERALSTLGSVLGLISSPFIIGVALFPIDTQLEKHIISTLIFFSFFVSATTLYSIAIILNQRHSNYFGFAGIFLFAISILIFIDPLAPHVAFIQKIVIYGYFIWVLLQVFIVERAAE